MSYDIAFKVKVDGTDSYLEVGDCDANITWSVRKIIELSTGFPWNNEANNGLCVDVIPKIQHGLEELQAYPEKYKPYEASNGWGTVKGTIHFFQQILKAWEHLMRSHEELAPVTTFWIE